MFPNLSSESQMTCLVLILKSSNTDAGGEVEQLGLIEVLSVYTGPE